MGFEGTRALVVSLSLSQQRNRLSVGVLSGECWLRGALIVRNSLVLLWTTRLVSLTIGVSGSMKPVT